MCVHTLVRMGIHCSKRFPMKSGGSENPSVPTVTPLQHPYRILARSIVYDGYADLATVLYPIIQFAVHHITWTSALMCPCCAEHATMVGQLVSATIVDKLQWYWVIPFFDASNDC